MKIQNTGTLTVYWADGKKSLYEISKLVKLEAGRTVFECLVDYSSFLEKMKLVKIQNR
jgi:hypothetical protein